MFCDIVDRKKAFLDYKNKKLKKSKNWHFFKEVNLVHGFCQKIKNFPSFYLKQNREEKKFGYILDRKKKPFWTIKTSSFNYLFFDNYSFSTFFNKKSKNWHLWMVLVKKILKLINYSWGQQPINEAYLGPVIPNEHSDENLTGFDLRSNTVLISEQTVTCILMSFFQ